MVGQTSTGGAIPALLVPTSTGGAVTSTGGAAPALVEHYKHFGAVQHWWYRTSTGGAVCEGANPLAEQ
jgi:hypothetical protein